VQALRSKDVETDEEVAILPDLDSEMVTGRAREQYKRGMMSSPSTGEGGTN